MGARPQADNLKSFGRIFHSQGGSPRLGHTHFHIYMDTHSESSATIVPEINEGELLRSAPIVTTFDRPEAASLDQALGVYVTIHGHFYQPPRENPDLHTIERQASAAPFHDWNERIYHECYRPNAFARILNDQGEVIDIVNNFEYLSFNIGPTLMGWLETYDAEVYQRIIEADRHSCDRLNGHGNAIAQVYNHMIMPLANHRDQVTQVRWGKADFQTRFGREPEGMWLAEAAVDASTLAVLISEGIRFIILAPSQVQRCRPLPPTTDLEDHPWQEVGGGQIDPTRPYRCFLPGGDRSREYIDIFFYDGPISRDIGFDHVLSSSEHLVGRLAQAVRGDHRSSQLIAVATDGETFGHHKRGTEKALTYAFTEEFPRRGWTVTNFAHFLSLHPPTWEVELKPVTAWSCAHGVDRWQDDCGCGGEGSLWHQKWRRPLRDALDWLRDRLSQIYRECGERLFVDPWQARDAYIHVICPPGTSQALNGKGESQDQTIQQFWTRHQHHPLTEAERVDALRLLEMQRHALLMYTSCGWFFEELSRPEGVQILRYAAHAIALAVEVAGVDLEPKFIQKLALAPSNIDQFQNGAEVYRQLVFPSQVGLGQVAAHYAITSLFTPYPQHQQLYCYQAEQLDYQLQRMGALTLAVGQVKLTSDVTHESVQLVFGVLHLGGWDFHCGVQPFSGRKHYVELKTQLFEILKQASAAPIVLAISDALGPQYYGLNDLFVEERHRIIALLSQETLRRLDQLYTQVYRDNYGILMAYQQDQLEVPQSLQMAAQVALSHRATQSLQGLERELSDPMNDDSSLGSSYLAELNVIATEAAHFDCQLNLGDAQAGLEQLILRLMWQLFHDLEPELIKERTQRLEQLITLVHQLKLDLSLDRPQELYLQALKTQIIPQCWHCAVQQGKTQQHGVAIPDLPQTPLPVTLSITQVLQLLHLGQKLAVDVSLWLDLLA